jgi:hypothetical protein
VDFLDPAVAEATTINWALVLVEEEKFDFISVESDAKVCIDALTGLHSC